MGIGAILALIGQGLLTGIGSGATSWFMGRILTAIAGAPDDSQLANALTNIQTELGVIAQAIQQVLTAINTLEQQLALDTTVLENYIQQAAINEDIAVILQHYADMQTMNQEAINKDTNPIYSTQTFASLVTGDWDIGAHVQAISDALLGNEGLSEGLLNTWTSYFIQRMGTNSAPGILASYYTTLQQLFEQQLQNQFKGVILMTSSVGIGCNAYQPCQPGLDYLTQFNGLLAQQVERFVECVERLVLSQFDMTAAVAQLSLPSDGPNVFATADLYAAVTLNQTPGLRGRLILKPGATAPTLPVVPGYAPSTGTLIAPSGYKCADWTTPVHQILAYEKSDLQVVRYAWGWPNPVPMVGFPIFGFFDGSVIPYYWDTTTYAQVSEPNPNTVLYANFIDPSSVLSNLNLMLTGWGSTSNAQPGTEVNITPSTGYPSPGGIEMSFALTGNQYFTDPATYDYSASQFLTVTYNGPEQQTIEIPFAITMNFQNYEMTNAMSQTEKFLTSVRATLTATSNLSGSQVLFDSNVMNDNSNASVNATFPITISSQSPVTLTCSVVATANEYESNYGNIPVGATASISLQINFMRLAWPLPAPGATGKRDA